MSAPIPSPTDPVLHGRERVGCHRAADATPIRGAFPLAGRVAIARVVASAVYPGRLGWLASALRDREIEALRLQQAAIQARLDALS